MPKSTTLFQLRTALMLPQHELAAALDTFQVRISEAERGISTNPKWPADLHALLENPSEALLYRLIRIVKFRNLVQTITNGDQVTFAEKAGISQGAVSVFLRARKKLLDSRWEGILARLGVAEAETTETDIEAARKLFAQMRDDEGYQLQNRLREGNVNMQEFAKRCGVSQGQLSWWFVSDKFNLDTRERIAKVLEEMEESPG